MVSQQQARKTSEAIGWFEMASFLGESQELS